LYGDEGEGALLADQQNEPIGKDGPLYRRHGLESALWQAHPHQKEYENQEEVFKFQIANFKLQI
jgi:hypothetical protein